MSQTECERAWLKDSHLNCKFFLIFSNIACTEKWIISEIYQNQNGKFYFIYYTVIRALDVSEWTDVDNDETAEQWLNNKNSNANARQLPVPGFFFQ